MSVAAEKETTMSVVNMAKDIKKVHPEDVALIKHWVQISFSFHLNLL